jgi:hypothetical protein
MDQQLLMSLLAARNGGVLPNGDDGAIDLAALDPQALLARMSQDNPAMAAILQMMEAQKTAAAREPVVLEGEAVDITASELAQISAQLDAAQAEVRLLRERCDTVAAALGACGLCWGQDSSCRACRGQGGPGHCIPDKELFYEFVVPAVRLMHASRQRANNVATLSSVTNGAQRADATPMHFTS